MFRARTDEQYVKRRAFGLCEKSAVAAFEIAFAHGGQPAAVDDQASALRCRRRASTRARASCRARPASAHRPGARPEPSAAARRPGVPASSCSFVCSRSDCRPAAAKPSRATTVSHSNRRVSASASAGATMPATTSRSSSSTRATSNPVAPSLANCAPRNAELRSSSRVASEPGTQLDRTAVRGLGQRLEQVGDLRGVGRGLRRAAEPQRRALEPHDPRGEDLARTRAQLGRELASHGGRLRRLPRVDHASRP